jgi:hypothetical protein
MGRTGWRTCADIPCRRVVRDGCLRCWSSIRTTDGLVVVQEENCRRQLARYWRDVEWMSVGQVTNAERVMMAWLTASWQMTQARNSVPSKVWEQIGRRDSEAECSGVCSVGPEVVQMWETAKRSGKDGMIMRSMTGAKFRTFSISIGDRDITRCKGWGTGLCIMGITTIDKGSM